MNAPEYLSLGEVAVYFGWTARFVERLAVTGKLPGVESAGQWRFRREDLVDWLDQKIQTLDARRVAELEFRLESELEAEGLLGRPHPGLLASRLQPAGIGLDLPVTTKPAILKSLAELAQRTGLVLDEASLHAALLEREALCSTALPGGIALVHPRRPLPATVQDAVLCFARTTAPVAFGAPDGEPTQLFFLVASLEERAHLHTLARLVRILRGFALDALRRAPDAATVILILRQRELEIDTAARVAL